MYRTHRYNCLHTIWNVQFTVDVCHAGSVRDVLPNSLHYSVVSPTSLNLVDSTNAFDGLCDSVVRNTSYLNPLLRCKWLETLVNGSMVTTAPTGSMYEGSMWWKLLWGFWVDLEMIRSTQRHRQTSFSWPRIPPLKIHNWQSPFRQFYFSRLRPPKMHNWKSRILHWWQKCYRLKTGMCRGIQMRKYPLTHQ